MSTIVIFTDLDGSLLDSDAYSFEDALPALSLLRKRNIPLILCSSKTRTELETYRNKLDNRHPFIAENGAGIFIPNRYFPFFINGETRGGYQVISFGIPYKEIRKQFTQLRTSLGVSVRGFGDMTAEEVSSLTGLTKDEAMLALQRDYEEPFIFPDGVNERFLHAIEASGFRWTQGRLFHMMGDYHKGRAVIELRNLYAQKIETVATIGLGNSLNDLSFLRLVDRPVLIKNTNGTHDPRVNIPGLYRTNEIGPRGWNEAILKLLQ